MATVVDLTNCDREPIHQPGAIQAHGVLFVCDPGSLEISHVSANTAAMLGLQPEELLGRQILSLFESSQQASVAVELRQDARDSKPVYLHTLGVQGKTFAAITHRSRESLFVELEPAEESQHTAPELYRLVERSITRLQQAPTLEELASACAAQVQKLNGFDRVMVYRFDQEWNGQVIAEERRSDLEPFLGLHYPASDIPAQARELYLRNLLRFIPDRDYTPARLLPEVGPESARPLDMSYAVLRSVSPIHLEYLRNMGVAASMSISLIRDGRLWGLVACHHYTPRYVPYDVRTACELLGQMMGLSIAAAEDRELSTYRQAMHDTAAALAENLREHPDTAKALIESTPNMLDFVQANGAAVVVGDAVTRIGQAPSLEDIRQLSAWLRAEKNEEIFATDNVSQYFGTGRLSSVAAGVLAVSLTASRPHQLLWFRAEQVRDVNWAGDPAKSVTKGDGSVRLSPRGSFSLWKETVKGRSAPWTLAELASAKQLREQLSVQILRRSEELAAANLDMRLASEEREKAFSMERAARSESDRIGRIKDDFVATLSHELRTPLNAILGWSQILARKDDLDSDIADGLEVIERNAKSQAKMIEDLLDVSRIISGKIRLDLQNTNLPAIVNASIDTVALAAASKNVRIEKLIDPLHGVHTTGDPTRLQQIFWNLLSNAVKFTPSRGKVQVVLERVDSHVELSVADTGRGIEPAFLPHVFERFRQADSSISRQAGGLGIGLAIVRDLVELHGGNVRAFSAGLGQGSTFVVSLPIRAINQRDPQTMVHPLGESRKPDCDALNLHGVRVLVLDDEPDARALVKRILEECECVATTAGSTDEALAAGAGEQFDLVISDIGIPGADGYEFIRRWREQEGKLQRKKTPVIALTAYARGEDRRKVLLAGFQAHLAKPVDGSELLALAASLVGRV